MDIGRTIKRTDDAIDAARAGKYLDFVAKPYHLAGSATTFSKFAEGLDPARAVFKGLTSRNMVTHLQANGFVRVTASIGEVIGTKGQTSIRIVIRSDGTIHTAFPVSLGGGL